MNDMPQEDPKTEALVSRFMEETQRALHVPPDQLVPPPESVAVSLAAYTEACRELLGAAPILPEELLARWKAYIADDSKLKLNFPAGTRCCVAVVPFTTYGNPLSSEEIARGDYLRFLMIDPSGKTVAGFSTNETYVASVLPQEVRDNVFPVGPYENSEPFGVTKNDRAMLTEAFENAYHGLRKLMENS